MHYTGSHSTWEVTWSHQDRHLSPIVEDGEGELRRVVSLLADEEDSGAYTCTVKGLEGGKQACTTYLHVAGKCGLFYIVIFFERVGGGGELRRVVSLLADEGDSGAYTCTVKVLEGGQQACKTYLHVAGK